MVEPQTPTSFRSRPSLRCARVVVVFVVALFHGALYAAEIRGKLTVLKKDGQTALEEFSHGLVYLTGIQTPPGETPAVSEQRDKSFHPRVLAVVKGQKIEFWNRDIVQHNVFCKDEKKQLDLDRYPTGQYKEEVFDEVGFYKVYCNIHQQMISDIVVLDNRYFAATEPSGEFAIRDVPPGKYTLHAWHIYGGQSSKEIEVANDNLTVDLAVTSTSVLRQLMDHKNKHGKSYSESTNY